MLIPLCNRPFTGKLSNVCLSDLPPKYTVNPGYKRTLILMAAKNEYGLTGVCNDWSREPTFLHHKTEVIRLLKEQISSTQNPEDWSFSAIVFLIMIEVRTAMAITVASFFADH